MRPEREARKAMYQQLRRDNPGVNKQMLKQLAYDLTREAVKNLNEGK